MQTWRLVLLMIGVLATPAAAQPLTKQPAPAIPVDTLAGEQAGPDLALAPVMPVTPLPAYDEATAATRIAALDRGVRDAKDPIARANALLARASYFAAQGRAEQLHMVEAQLRADDRKQPGARQPFLAEAARRQALVTQALGRAIEDLLALTCEASDRARGPGCATPAALRAWSPLDEALARLGALLAISKRDAEAAQVYRRLVTDLPRSRYAAEAAVAVGEHAFAQADLALAETMYTLGLTAPGLAARTYARYKLGWVQFNLGRGDEAVASFAAVATTAPSDPQLTRLAREARKDLVRAYAVAGTAAGARAAFEQAAPGHGLDLLVQLGDLWLEQGRAGEARTIFDEALRLAPLDARQCAWQASLARGAEMLGDPARMVTELEHLHAALARMRKLPSPPAAALATCTDATRSLTRERAFALHRDAERTRDARTLEFVDQLYGWLLSSFPGEVGLADVAYKRSEAAWLRAEVERADPRRWWSIAIDRCDAALQVASVGSRASVASTCELARQRAAKPPRSQHP